MELVTPVTRAFQQCLQSQQKDASKVMSEVFDLKETVIWKNKKIEVFLLLFPFLFEILFYP